MDFPCRTFSKPGRRIRQKFLASFIASLSFSTPPHLLLNHCIFLSSALSLSLSLSLSLLLSLCLPIQPNNSLNTRSHKENLPSDDDEAQSYSKSEERESLCVYVFTDAVSGNWVCREKRDGGESRFKLAP